MIEGRIHGSTVDLGSRSGSVLLTARARTRRALSFLAFTLVSVQLWSQTALAADIWFLLARHGECFPIRSLERKFPDLGNLAEPESFIEFVRAKGLMVSVRPIPARTGSAVQVLVPAKGLALVFVTAELCSKVEVR